ncbi:MAG TPA: sugar ABC transporter substrate-binding protein [Clostridiales bacterium]|nr:sugar ABC transporter substrate-binding protein [Clostridiales bacterium]
MKKKVLSLLLVAIFSFSFLTACGGESNGEDSTKQEENSEGGSEIAIDSGAGEGKVKIQTVQWNAIPEGELDYNEAFMDANPNIEVDTLIVPEDEYSTKINSMVMAGTAPDVMLVWECDISKLITNGMVDPLDKYIDETDEFSTDDLIPAVSKLSKMTDGTYGLPWCYAAEILYYNKDMFDEAGVDYPTNEWTWKDFEEAAKSLTIVEDGKTVQWGCDAFTIPGIWFSTIGAAGDDIFIDGRLQLGEGAKKALEWQYDLTNTYKVCPQPAASGASDVADLFMAGQAAMTRTGSWMCSVYKDITDFKWDIAPLPKGERDYNSLHTGFYTIYTNSENKDAAWRYIEWMLSDEGQEIICKATGNPSARKSIEEKGFYRVEGKNGPTNWDAFAKSAESGQFGYVLAPQGLTNYAVQLFSAAMLDEISIEDALLQIEEESQKIAEENK